MIGLDDKDRKLLTAIQKNARLTISELSEQVGLSVSGVKKRLVKLEDNGVISQYATLLNRSKLGLGLLCFIELSLEIHARKDVAEFDFDIQQLPEVLECHRLTGAADYLLKVVVCDREHLDSFLMDKLMSLPAVGKLKTSVVLKEIKETTEISMHRLLIGD